MAQKQFVDLYQGENRTLNLIARDNSNNPTDLTGKTITWAVAYPPYDPSLRQAVITKTGTITDAVNGLFTVAIIPNDTACLTGGNYEHQAYTLDNAGSVSVVTEGTFRLRCVVQPIT